MVTNFPPPLLDTADKIRPGGSFLALTFRVGDRTRQDWDRFLYLASVATSVTLISRPQTTTTRPFNHLATISYSPFNLTELHLIGFTVDLYHLFDVIEERQSLVSMSIILSRVYSLMGRSCSLPNLCRLRLGGHPDNFAKVGEHLHLPALERLTLEPRGKQHYVNNPLPPSYLTDDIHVTISGDLTWEGVNRYINSNLNIVSVDVEVFEEATSTALLMNLALQDVTPNVHARLVHFGVTPLSSVQSVLHLLPLIKKNNPQLCSLHLGVDRGLEDYQDAIPGMKITTGYSSIPQPLTRYDNIREGSDGNGIYSKDTRCWNSQWDGDSSPFVELESMDDSCSWYP
jgi:hypothetical protein